MKMRKNFVLVKIFRFFKIFEKTHKMHTKCGFFLIKLSEKSRKSLINLTENPKLNR